MMNSYKPNIKKGRPKKYFGSYLPEEEVEELLPSNYKKDVLNPTFQKIKKRNLSN